MRRRYGASPLHLLGHVVALVACAYALSLLIGTPFAPQTLNLVLWLVGGAILHDAVAVPLYSLADRGAQRALGADVNFVRFPVVVSATLLLVYAPSILDRQPQNVVNALGRSRPDYLGRWLAVTVALFALSAAWWLARRALAGRPRSDR